MAKVGVHIWHGADGEIVAIGHPGPKSKAQFVPVGGPGIGIMEADVEEKYIADLHKTHVVDIQRKILREHPEKQRPESPSQDRSDSR
jgi:hypothetical protein